MHVNPNFNIEVKFPCHPSECIRKAREWDIYDDDKIYFEFVWILNFFAALSSLSVVVLWNVAWKAHFEAFNFESTLGYAQTVHIHSFICLFSYLFATFFSAFRVCVPLTTLEVSGFYWVCEQSDCSWSGCRKFGFNRAERIWRTKSIRHRDGKVCSFLAPENCILIACFGILI